MAEQLIFIGNTPLQQPSGTVEGTFTQIHGEDFFQISHVDQMRPFLMSIVSPTNQWLFLSSNGALTAGRQNPQHALFPYYTDDKIHDSSELTGSKSIFLVEQNGKRLLWEPFSPRYQGAYALQRNLYKHVYGHKILFEEINQTLGLRFRYSWESSHQWGFVRRSWLENTGTQEVQIEVLDGMQNLLPYGVTLAMQTELSTLVDAYKKNELDPETGLGIYMLSSILVDKPEPSEALKATSVWSAGLKSVRYMLSSLQVEDFRQGKPLRQEVDVRAERGAYFVHSRLNLAPAAPADWLMVAEVEQGPAAMRDLQEALRNKKTLVASLLADIDQGTEALRQIVARADGLQHTQDRLNSSRHFSNVLFNLMRGGIFDHNYRIDAADFQHFLRQANQPLKAQLEPLLRNLPAQLSLIELIDWAGQQGSSDLTRLVYEYLPLTFSRRHGDPSRPWNFFSIETQREDGSKILNYQGNWRDIFQNWEALALSYPSFVESMITKFVNASTADGYNPYRITREGIDWEVTDPHDPWSFIGYWGDHQIIYLQKLLEVSAQYHPGQLRDFLHQEQFAYAHVPYRIKPYADLLANPKDTIIFEEELDQRLKQRAAGTGSDGKLYWNTDGRIYAVNFTEKLLVPILAKFTNFIPETGIWLNTQRPEWNDANNALVGYGVSMVTLYYMRRFQLFCRDLFRQEEGQSFAISMEVATLLSEITESFARHTDWLSGPFSDQQRKHVLDELGTAGSHYRAQLYTHGFSGQKRPVSAQEILQFIDLSLQYIDHAIAANRRQDHLYHAYNLISFPEPDKVSVRHLYEMLEGQVAVLSSGALSIAESVQVLDAMKQSDLYREDQFSYLLYPNRQLPRFLEKNQLPATALQESSLLQALVRDGNHQLVEQNQAGGLHFNGTFRNGESVAAALIGLAENGYANEVATDRERILAIFEEMFDHQSFTGRSGTFYGYEGLGSIYWHMVSKLLLAVGETYYRAVAENAPQGLLSRLVEHYYEIRSGIGMGKNPAVYGAFPIDPYSHTPGNAGAQQPGMTGQVKEDILSRWNELGLRVAGGKIHFHPVLLRREEFVSEPTHFRYFALDEQSHRTELPAGSLAFTYCQIPVVYHLSDTPRIQLHLQDGSSQAIPELELNESWSQKIFNRSGEISKVEVWLTPVL